MASLVYAHDGHSHNWPLGCPEEEGGLAARGDSSSAGLELETLRGQPWRVLSSSDHDVKQSYLDFGRYSGRFSSNHLETP